ncbi:hypothetical protein EP232_00580, partial [bacterium]
MAALIAVSCASREVRRDDTATIKFAHESLQDGQFDMVITGLESFVSQNPGSPQVAEAQFLMGEAAVGKIDWERENGELSGMMLNNIISPLMSKAYDSFMAASQESKDREFVSRSLYRAGNVLDYNYMRRFKDAMHVYRKVFE